MIKTVPKVPVILQYRGLKWNGRYGFAVPMAIMEITARTLKNKEEYGIVKTQNRIGLFVADKSK